MKKNFQIDNNLFAKPLQLGAVNLVQLGRLYCEPGEVIGEHYHNNLYELTVITGGKGIIFNEKTQYFVVFLLTNRTIYGILLLHV